MRTKQSEKFVEKLINKFTGVGDTGYTKNQLNCFYCKNTYDSKYTVVYNETGSCWVEEFSTVLGALNSIYSAEEVIEDIRELDDMLFDMESIGSDDERFDKIFSVLTSDNHKPIIDLIADEDEEIQKKVKAILKKY